MTKRILILLLIFPFTLISQVEKREIGNLVIENIPEFPQELIERTEQYQNVRSAIFSGWDAEDKGIFIRTRFAETSQVHYVMQPGGMRAQLTFFKEPISGMNVRPSVKEQGFLFFKDIGGNELYQIYYYDMATGRYKMLTDGKSRNESPVWSKDGAKFAFRSNMRNGKDFDIYMVSMDKPLDYVLLRECSGSWAPLSWSPDGKKLLLLNYISINQSTIYIFNIDDKSLTPLQKSDELLAMGYAVWSSDGNSVYFTSDFDNEFQYLQKYDIKSGKITPITKEIPWDVIFLGISKNGNSFGFITNEDGMSKVYLLDQKTLKYKQIKSIPQGIIEAFQFTSDGNRLAFTVNSYNTAGDVYVVNVSNEKLERWTYSEVGGLNTDNFIKPELIHYPTFDSVDGKVRKIPAYYYKPKGKGPFPVVIYFHGGPEAQYQPGFVSTFQFWLNEMGIAVLAPNVRGSSGYGKTFLQLDNGYLRENSVKDGGALLDWIAKNPDLDASRVCVYGGSYGGYMVLAMMTHYNDRISAGVNIVGISNFVTFLENTSEYRRDLRRVEYGDERDPDMRAFLQKISPTNNAHKITKPLLIIQGLNDPRVPVTEAEQIRDIVRKNGGDVWYLLAKDEGHGFAKKSNRDFSQNATVLFLQKVLLNK